jgi:26S proteasome regulatory subunit N2
MPLPRCDNFSPSSFFRPPCLFPIHLLIPPAPFLSSSEILYEDESFKLRGLAALVASKVLFLSSQLLLPFPEIHPQGSILQVYYHLGEYEDSLNFALGAGDFFDLSLRTEYVEKTICRI